MVPPGDSAGELQIGAVVVVNAFGDIFDWKTGKKAAGLLNEDRSGFKDSVEVMLRGENLLESGKG